MPREVTHEYAWKKYEMYNYGHSIQGVINLRIWYPKDMFFFHGSMQYFLNIVDFHDFFKYRSNITQ